MRHYASHYLHITGMHEFMDLEVPPPLEGRPESTRAQDFSGPSTSLMNYMVAGARFELATFGL